MRHDISPNAAPHLWNMAQYLPEWCATFGECGIGGKRAGKTKKKRDNMNDQIINRMKKMNCGHFHRLWLKERKRGGFQSLHSSALSATM
jgi:hypothetical protein